MAVIDELGPRDEAIARLRVVIEDFYSRLVDDVMIGFLFAGKDRARLIAKETEFTARFLGADLPYTGRTITRSNATPTAPATIMPTVMASSSATRLRHSSEEVVQSPMPASTDVAT